MMKAYKTFDQSAPDQSPSHRKLIRRLRDVDGAYLAGLVRQAAKLNARALSKDPANGKMKKKKKATRRKSAS